MCEGVIIFLGGNIQICLMLSFYKKTQKAPQEEIAIAKERRADYEQRQKKDKRH